MGTILCFCLNTLLENGWSYLYADTYSAELCSQHFVFCFEWIYFDFSVKNSIRTGRYFFFFLISMFPQRRKHKQVKNSVKQKKNFLRDVVIKQ